MNDLKFAFRQLLKNPGFTAVAVLTLALGIGACTAIFSLINAALLRPLPFPDSERLAVIWADNPGRRMGFAVSPPANADVAEWRRQSESFARVAAFSARTADLADGGDAERVGAAAVTAGLFETLGVTPPLGRTLAPDEEAPGGPPVVLISHGLWQRRFGGDRGLLGKGISVNGEKRTVIGIRAVIGADRGAAPDQLAAQSATFGGSGESSYKLENTQCELFRPVLKFYFVHKRPTFATGRSNRKSQM